MLMKRDDSLLLIIDVQERLAPAMDSPREVITGCAKLIGVARRLGVPFIITEQYPKGLGPTMADLRQAAGDDAGYLSKTEFSCARNKEIMNNIKKSGKKQIIIAGIESHICVLQTALDLKELGYEVFVVSNACSSRPLCFNTWQTTDTRIPTAAMRKIRLTSIPSSSAHDNHQKQSPGQGQPRAQPAGLPLPVLQGAYGPLQLLQIQQNRPLLHLAVQIPQLAAEGQHLLQILPI